MKPTPNTIYRELREYLSEQVARAINGEPGPSKALWLLEHLEQLAPKESQEKHVYIAGPISSDPLGHMRAAMDAGDALLSAGLVPFVPHLSCYWQITHPRSYEDWMAFDLAWLRRCDALLRLPGHSPGADREVAFAREIGLPVFVHTEQAIDWAKGGEG